MSVADTRRFIIIVLDGAGIGALPDAADFGDAGAHTIGHTCQAVPDIQIPNLAALGLGNIADLQGVPAAEKPSACFGKMGELSAGKDTTVGHWEIAGLITGKRFPTYPDGFPEALVTEFETRIGRKVIGNKAASGEGIIKELGEEHLQTGKPILYTSADSVFQIAAHEAIVPLDQLYEFCQIARSILRGDHVVARVIARPFIGSPGQFKRANDHRKDFSIAPPKPTALDCLKEAGYDVIGIGKIGDIFLGQGVTESVHTDHNAHGMTVTNSYLRKDFNGLLFVNLVDFDMKFGHRRNPLGFAQALMEFDGFLKETLELLRHEDILIITADHGCDPLYTGSDHTREYVPLLVCGPCIQSGINLGIRKTFADIGQTLVHYFSLSCAIAGESFLHAVHRK